MAKDVLATADAVLLPRWASGDVVIKPEPVLIVNASLEVPLRDGAIRPDVLVQGMASEIEFSVLCFEVRVRHAVDEPKRSLLATNGIDAIEIDLSGLDEEAVVDSATFRREVLENTENRRWIHLSNASYVSHHADKALIEVEDLTITERTLITKAGRPFTIREQGAFLVKPGSRDPVRIQIPDDTVGEEVQPYPRGMHTVSARSLMVDEWGRLRLRYKMYLDQIQMNPSKLELPQGALFEASEDGGAGPGFRVQMRDWKGSPGY